MGRRVQERHLNRAGSAPKLKTSLNSSTPNGQILIWSQADQAFTIGDASGAGGSSVDFQCYASAVTVYTTDGTRVISQFPFNAGDYSSGVFKLQGVLSSGDGSNTLTVSLFNLTDNEEVKFADSTAVKIHTTSSTPAVLTTAALTAGTAAGNLKTTQKIYELRATMTGTGSSSTQHSPIASSETLDRTNWHYIEGNNQSSDTNTAFQPRDPSSAVDGVSADIIAFWKGGTNDYLQARMLSYKPQITSDATLTFKIIKGPNANIYAANGTDNLSTGHGGDEAGSAVLVSTSATTYQNQTNAGSADWQTHSTTNLSSLSSTTWTTVTVNLSRSSIGADYYVAIRQAQPIGAANKSWFAIADVTLTLTTSTADNQAFGFVGSAGIRIE